MICYERVKGERVEVKEKKGRSRRIQVIKRGGKDKRGSERKRKREEGM